MDGGKRGKRDKEGGIGDRRQWEESKGEMKGGVLCFLQ